MSQDRGEPRIAGRIFGLLLIEGQELSLQQISEQLGVSRASVRITELSRFYEKSAAFLQSWALAVGQEQTSEKDQS